MIARLHVECLHVFCSFMFYIFLSPFFNLCFFSRFLSLPRSWSVVGTAPNPLGTKAEWLELSLSLSLSFPLLCAMQLFVMFFIDG